MWNYPLLVVCSTFYLLAVIGTDEDELPKEIVDCLEDAKIIVPRLMGYYNDCVKRVGYNMEDISADAYSKLTKVDSCFDKARSQDKSGSAVVDKCNKATETLSDSQREKVAQIMFELESSAA